MHALPVQLLTLILFVACAFADEPRESASQSDSLSPPSASTDAVDKAASDDLNRSSVEVVHADRFVSDAYEPTSGQPQSEQLQVVFTTFTEVVSRAWSAWNYAVPEPQYTEAISRSVSAVNHTLRVHDFVEAISRAVGVVNHAPRPHEFVEAISRAITACNGCATFVGGCNTSDWNCFNNWDIPGDVYPDNTDTTTYNVKIDTTSKGAPAAVLLNVPVEIDELRLGRSGTLRITSDVANDLTVVEPGGVVNAGTLLVGFDRRIDVLKGPMRVDSDGIYQADPVLTDVGAMLVAQGVVLDSPDSDIFNGEKAQMILTDRMHVQSDGDFVIQSNPSAFYVCGGATAANVAGGITPPILKIRNQASLDIAGSFVLSNAASLDNTSALPMRVRGDFVNNSVYPGCFECLQATWVMDSTTSRTFEAAGEDRGPSLTGFDANFGIGTLELAANTVVRVVDAVDNQQDGVIGCDEVLYVRNLVLRAGSRLETDDGCRVYFETLQNQGGQIPGLGTSVLSVIAGDADGDGDVDLTDFVKFRSCMMTKTPDAICIGAFDVDRTSQIDLRDFASFQRRFTGAH